MSAEEKIKEIKIILSEQIAWYNEHNEKEAKGEVDSSYVYDCLVDQFGNLSRGSYIALLDTLLK